MQPTSLQDLDNALEYVSADVPRDDWVLVLMGIKNEFGDDAFDIAERWSQGGGTYNKDNFKSTWRNISAAGSTTINTVFKLAINNGYKPEKKELSPEDKARFKKEQAARVKARAEQEEKALAERQKWHEVIAEFSLMLLKNFTITITSNEYLSLKRVNAYGVYGFKQSLIVLFKPNFVTEVIMGGSNINQFFVSLPEKKDRNFSFLHVKRGDLAVPLMDVNKRIFNLQVINASGGKMFLKHGRKSGCFHFIGKAASGEIIAVAEGYATAATIYMATSWPVAVAIDSGNLLKVSLALKAALPDHKFIICADNDSATKGNPGISKAVLAAKAVNGTIAVPNFYNKKAL